MRTPALLSLLLLSSASAQPSTRPERPDMPPAPPARLGTSTPAVNLFPRGPFVSVQVNIDEVHDNIVGDAANEPSLAVDPTAPLRMAIGWRQFDTVNNSFRQAGRAYTRDGGRTWTFPGPLTPGIFRSDPCMRADSQGAIYFCSLQQSFNVDIFRSTDGGASFGFPSPAFGGDKQWLAIDRTSLPSSGTQYEHFTQGFTRSFNRGMTWSNPISGIPVWGNSIVGPDAAVYIAGVQNAGGGTPIRVARSLNAFDPSQTPTFSTVNINLAGGQRFNVPNTPNPGGLLGQVNVAVDSSTGPRHGWVYVLCSVGTPNDPLDVMLNRSTDGGQTWLPVPIRVNNDAPAPNSWQWFGTMSVAPNGRIDVVWNDTRESGQANLSRLYYAFSTNGGDTWQGNTPLGPQWDSTVGWPQQNKIGDYYDMESDLLGANLAYAATYNNEQDVYFLRIGPRDCNGNALDDAAEIAANPALDCNHDGILDTCQIAAGTLRDANHDGVSDACECLADWNHSGAVNSQDYFDFLTDFFNNDADYNHSGATNSQDFFDFIAAFFTGC